jgi:transposase InsO family protein
VLRYCGISRQAHHQALQRRGEEAEKAILYIALMTEIRLIHPGMGLRTMYEISRPEGIGRDAFIALGLQEGFRLTTLENQIRTTYSVKSNRYKNLLGDKEFNDINQLWSSDITYFFCDNKFFYLVFVMDVYSRRILGYHEADNMRAENNVATLQMALDLRGISHYNFQLIHHTDKGTQYTSDIYTDLLTSYGIQISMCTDVLENSHIERVNGTIKNQYLKRWPCNNEKQLKANLAKAVKAYNETRPNENLGNMSPVQYENYLKTITSEKHKKMTIYTVRLHEENKDTKQISLF